MAFGQGMINMISMLLIPLLLMGGLFAGSIVLQVKLCKKEAHWLGLILPAITLLAALFTTFGIMTYTLITNEKVTIVSEKGQVVEERTVETPPKVSSGTVATMGYTFIVYNIPTVVYLAIYGAYRGKRKRQKALERMQAQDLE